MSPEVRAEWHPRSDFAEVAEALGVTTTDIMALTGVESGRGALVVYSTGCTDESPESGWVHRALLERDADGVMQVAKHHRNWVPVKDFMARVEEGLETHLTKTLGPPEPK